MKKKNEIQENANIFNNTNHNKNKNKPLKKFYVTWCKFIKYLIMCTRNTPTISYYLDFRKKLISEENIIQDHLDIDILQQINNSPKNSNY